MSLSIGQLVETLGEPTRREPFTSRNMRGQAIAVTQDYYLWFRCGCHAYQVSTGSEYILRPCGRRDCPRGRKLMM